MPKRNLSYDTQKMVRARPIKKKEVNINIYKIPIFIAYLNVSNSFMQILQQDRKETPNDTKIKIPLHAEAMSVCAYLQMCALN